MIHDNNINPPIEGIPLLKGTTFTKEKISDARNRNKMLMLSLETSNICNLRCIYCFNDAGRKKEDELTIYEYFRIIDEAIDLGVKTVTIAGAGEPFSDPNLYKILQYLAKKGIYTVVYTNQTLITNEKAKELFQLNLSIMGTLNSFNESLQNKLFGNIPWGYKKMLEGLQNLMNAGFNDSVPTRLGIDCPVFDQNYDEIPEIFRFARQNNIYPEISTLFLTGRAKTFDLKGISIENERELVGKLCSIDKNEFGIILQPTPPFLTGSKCDRLYYNFVVNVIGDVLPCYGTEIKIGNIREKSVKELWNHEFLIKVRSIDKYMKGKCKSCEYSADCFGCPVRTYAKTGDFFGEYIDCWKETNNKLLNSNV